MQTNDSGVATISRKEEPAIPRVDNGEDKTSTSQEKQVGTSIDEALELTGSGWFHHVILLCAGVVFLACGFQNGLSAYILPSCKCDFNLSSAQLGLLNAVFLAGTVTSAYLHGLIADTYGRKPIIVLTLIGDAICSVLTVIAPNFIVLSTLRFICGFLIGGPSGLVFLYLSEYVPISRKPTYTLLLGLFWTISWMILPALAWVIIPATWPQHLPIPLSSWRVYIGIMAFPSLLGAFLTYLMPETPLYLYSRGRTSEAMTVLAKIYSWNNGKSAADYPVKELQKPVYSVESVGASKSGLVTAVRAIGGQLLSLVKPPILFCTAISFAASFCNMFTYYGLVLWLPELFSRFEAHYDLFPDRTMTMCQLTRAWPDELAEARLNSSAEGLMTSDSATSCDGAVNEGVFIQTLIISSVCLVANAISAAVASRVGRRTMPTVTNLMAALLVVAVYFVKSTFAMLIVASLFQGAISTANTIIQGLAVSIFPPQISGLGVVTAVLAGRLGAAVSNLVLGALIDINCEVPLFLLALLAGVAGILCCFIPLPFGVNKNDAREKSKTSAAAA